MTGEHCEAYNLCSSKTKLKFSAHGNHDQRSIGVTAAVQSARVEKF